MKIEKIQTFLANTGGRNLCFVKVHTDDGLYGIGEAYSVGPDRATEAAIHDTLLRLREGRTVIAVTHRLWTVTEADVLFVLDRGRVVESGRHEELLTHGGVYARLWSGGDVPSGPEASATGGLGPSLTPPAQTERDFPVVNPPTRE